MTTEQLLREFEGLPREEQQAIAHEIQTRLHNKGAAQTVQQMSPETPEARRARRRATAKRLEGALQWPGTPPSDAEIQHLRDDYLREKYG